MYEKTQRDNIPVELVQSSPELEGHPAEEEGLLEGIHEMEERVMRKDKYKIQVGNKLYEASKSYHKVFEWEVLEICLEAYLGGWKTIVKCSNGTWTKEFFCADMFEFYNTYEEAEQALKGGEG